MFVILGRRQLRYVIGCLALLAMTAVVTCCLLAPESVATAGKAGNWGLGFHENGKPPTGNASPAELKAVDAYFLGDTNSKVIYLTFDAGYENGYTPAILDALKKHGVKATFFVVGNYIETSGQDMVKFYRPPQGKYSEQNLQQAKELGYKTFFWSLAYVDWYVDKQPTKEQAFSKLLSRIHPGAIVLLHSTSKTNAEILDELLTKWKEMGYTFGTLADL